jgi:hypothetical protein
MMLPVNCGPLTLSEGIDPVGSTTGDDRRTLA